MNIKSCNYQFSFKDFGENGRFCGYASIFNVVDDQNDMVLPGAFTDTLKFKNNVKLLWQHQPKEPIGNILELKENDLGLYLEAQLLLDLQKAKEVYLMLKSNIINSLSIGYRPIDYEIDSTSNVRCLKKIDLWEISLVTFPSNSKANIISVKSVNDEIILLNAIKNAKRILDDSLH